MRGRGRTGTVGKPGTPGLSRPGAGGGRPPAQHGRPQHGTDCTRQTDPVAVQSGKGLQNRRSENEAEAGRKGL